MRVEGQGGELHFSFSSSVPFDFVHRGEVVSV